MKISSRIKGSLCGASLPNRQGHWLGGSLGNRARAARGCQLRQSRRRQQSGSSAAHAPKARPEDDPESTFLIPWVPPPVFVKALPGTSQSSNERSSRFWATPITKRWSHSGVDRNIEVNQEHGEENKPEDATEQEVSRANSLSPGFFQNKQELLSLVDQSQHGSVDDYLQLARDLYRRGYAEADGPLLTVSERDEDINFPSFAEVRDGPESVRQDVLRLWRAIRRRLENPYKTDIEYIYRLYQRLPEPRIPYLHAKIRHNLTLVFGREEKNRASMLRYFAIISDIQNSGLRLIRAEWNSVLAFAARFVGTSTETEVAAALQHWQEMESEAGIKGNSVTFNILFDVASKAGNFVLAEMLYKEMEKRKLKYNRYHHVSLIHFFGLKMDSDGVRAAYKEMVEAGEIIDSTVLNCVIAGFLRCGEEYAAEHVYERMKSAHSRAPKMPFRNYMKDVVVTKVLTMFARISRESASQGNDNALHKHLQKLSPIVPDLHTYRILLNHYAVRMSALEKVAQFLDDMKYFHVPLHGAIFLALFKGFALHGGPGQRWSAQRLQNVWKAFQTALAENANGLYVDAWMAQWILRAFKKCETEDRVWQVWAELRPRCELDFDPDDREHFEKFLMNLFKKPRRLPAAWIKGRRGLWM